MAGTKADGTGRRGALITDITPPPPMTRAAGRGLQTITGADTAWMGPANPMQPQVQDAAGRQRDYPVAINLNMRPRAEEGVSFGDLRGLADAYSLVRLAIETRKDQLVKLKWKVKPIDPKQKPDARCDELNAFFASPDKRHNWQDWVRILMEDVLVIDAPAVYFHPNLGKRPYAFEIIDGATIKLLLDIYGRTPAAPQPAYQQNLKGIPAVDYIVPTMQYPDMPQLIYRPRNPRSWKTYGYSPVEQIVMIVNIGLRREISQLQFYTEGNIPEALIGTPNTWNPDQIKQFQSYWDSLLEGNTAARRHAKFVPGGMTVHETKSEQLTDLFDEWLARVVMYCFSLPASAFTKQTNRATAETAKEQAEEEGLAPIMQWVADFVNYLIVTYWGFTDIAFDWTEEKSIDPLIQAQIHDIYLKNGTLTNDEVRADLGREALPPEESEEIDDKDMGEQDSPDDNADVTQGAKAAHTHGLKKKTYAKLSASNVKRAKALAGGYTKFFGKLKPKVIKQVVAAYGRVKKADDSGDSITEALDLDFTAIVQVTAKHLKKAALEGVETAQNALTDAGHDIAFDNDEIAEGVGNYRAAEMVGMRFNSDGVLVENPNAEYRIDDATRELLAGDVNKALQEGWSTDKLAGELEDNYAFSDARAETIARTEVARADMQGSMETYRESGVVTGKKWLLAEDPCPICEGNANDGVIGLDDNFSSGDDAAPAHPNCECDVAPVIESPDESK